MRNKNRRDPERKTTVRGVVALAEWSDSRQNADVVILTDTDEEYYLDARDTDIRPATFVNARVEATGKLHEREDQYILEVSRIQVIDSDEDFSDIPDVDLDSDAFDDEDFGVEPWGDNDDYADYARLIRGHSGF